MCGLIEEYGDLKKAEGKAESIVQMLQSGLSHEEVAKILSMSVDKVEELESLAMVNA